MFPQPPESLPQNLYEGLVSALGMADNPLFESFTSLDQGTQQVLRSAASTYFSAVKHALWTVNAAESE